MSSNYRSEGLISGRMQDFSDTNGPHDDMVDGDLGDGMRVVAAPGFCSRARGHVVPSMTLLPDTELLCSNTLSKGMAWTSRLKVSGATQKPCWKELAPSSLDEMSRGQLKDRLHEASEMINILLCELDVTHHYLQGKYEALKILQGKAILDKATSHTKKLLQKSEERAKSLEKEVNSLQWELSFSQMQMKKSELSWEQKHSRILNENKTLSDNLVEREQEAQQLRVENAALSRQCLELVSMLDVKEQKAYQRTRRQYSTEGDASVVELAVLAACSCNRFSEPCPCSRTAAATRMQLTQLQQELDAQCSRREEASMVADAFRIAFEQQLQKRSEDFMLLADANILKLHQCKSDGAYRHPLLSLSQRLRDLLPSKLEVKMPDHLLDTLYRLLDLLNDKEEALAHQRKVSVMLAQNAEELQRQLDLKLPSLLPQSAKSKIASELTSETQRHFQTSPSKPPMIKAPTLSQSTSQADLSDAHHQPGHIEQELSQAVPEAESKQKACKHQCS